MVSKLRKAGLKLIQILTLANFVYVGMMLLAMANMSISHGAFPDEVSATNGECQKTVDTETKVVWLCKPQMDIAGHIFEPIWAGTKITYDLDSGVFIPDESK